MVNAPALYDGGSFTSVNHPVGMFFMVCIVMVVAVIVTSQLYNIRTVLCALPGHIIGTDGNSCIFLGVMDKHISHQSFRQTHAFCFMGIVNFVTDTPHDNGGMVSVPANPACHVLFCPFIEKSGVVVFGLGLHPHIECFRNNIHTHGIR